MFCNLLFIINMLYLNMVMILIYILNDINYKYKFFNVENLKC